MLTVRGEIAKRLKVYWKVNRKRPDSYNACLGIGKPGIDKDKPFNGYGIDNMQYIDGLKVLTTYAVWDRGYYESASQMFPREDQIYGRFVCTNLDDLKHQLVEAGFDPEQCRWEPR